jgi:hypothetical protein
LESGIAIAAAPSTAVVCERPANDSEFEIEETNKDPAATVPATPTPLRIWVVAKTLMVRF